MRGNLGNYLCLSKSQNFSACQESQFKCISLKGIDLHSKLKLGDFLKLEKVPLNILVTSSKIKNSLFIMGELLS